MNIELYRIYLGGILHLSGLLLHPNAKSTMLLCFLKEFVQFNFFSLFSLESVKKGL